MGVVRERRLSYLRMWAAVVLREALETFAGVTVALVHTDQVGGARIGLAQVKLRKRHDKD